MGRKNSRPKMVVPDWRNDAYLRFLMHEYHYAYAIYQYNNVVDMRQFYRIINLERILFYPSMPELNYDRRKEDDLFFSVFLQSEAALNRSGW